MRKGLRPHIARYQDISDIILVKLTESVQEKQRYQEKSSESGTHGPLMCHKMIRKEGSS